MSYNKDISEKYEKWVVRIILKEKYYYILWGNDTTTFNHDANVLVDENKRMLLFSNIKSLVDYIKKSDTVFDKKSSLSWVKKLKYPIRSSATFNIDLLKNKRLSISTRESFNALISALDIPDDYAHCTNDKKILRTVLAPQLRNLFDYYCNMYLWTPDKKLIAANSKKLNSKQVTFLLNKVYEQFLEKIAIVN